MVAIPGKALRRRSGGVLYSAEGLPRARHPDRSGWPQRAEGAGSTAHGTEAVAHESYIIEC